MTFEKIDTHAHFIPPFYRTACEESGNSKPDGMPAIPPWSEESHLDLMKNLSITKSIISISSPGVHLHRDNDISAQKLARQCNEFAGDLARRRPNEFGFWATLPLPDICSSFKEIHYALDRLKAQGIALETNYHGTYLGDPAFDEIFNELNRRQATVFIHPTSPCMQQCGSHSPTKAAFLPQFPNPVFEFMFDTARALINLFLSGTIFRCPKITFVIPHAGGSLPPVIQRFCSFATDILGSEVNISSQIVKETFRKQFYFDLAGFPFPDQIWGLLRYIGPEQLLYGSDFPFTPARGVTVLAEKMEVGLEDVFPDEAIRRGIYNGNARRMLGDQQDIWAPESVQSVL